MSGEKSIDFSKQDTVQTNLDEAQREIDALRVHGLTGVRVIKILEILLNVTRTLAIHTVQARLKTHL